MKEIVVEKIRKPQQHRNTLREYSKEIQEDRYQYVLKRISENIPSGKVLYIFGMGKHPKSTYINLKGMSGIEVVWYGSLLPGYMAFLRVFMASYEGIVKVLEPIHAKEVFDILSKMSMVGLYIFDKSLEHSFVQTIKAKKYSTYADQIIKDDSSYFIYQIDADSLESSTGIYEIVSYGRNCPNELTGILELK